MKVVKKASPSKGGKAEVKKRSLVANKKLGLMTNRKVTGKDLGLSLPTSFTEPSNEFENYSLLLFGKKKIGKTSLAAQFSGEKTLFIMTEPGAKSLRLKKVDARSWTELLGYLSLLEKDESFTQIVLDTCDIAYELCFEYICEMKGIEHPGDEAYGKGWSAVKGEFSSFMKRLLSLGKGVVLISHDKVKEVETYGGKKYTQIVPTLSGQAEDIVAGMVDMWFYYTYENDQRVLILEGDDHISAGRRMQDDHFYYNGQRIKEVNMGSSASEAHKNFMLAWNNKYSPDKKPATSTKVVKKKG